MANSDFPEIITLLDGATSHVNRRLYRHAIKRTLKSILSKEVSVGCNIDTLEEFKKQFFAKLPLFSVTKPKIAPGHISLYMLTKHRPGAHQFFSAMINNSLMPGKCLNVISSFTSDFKIPLLSDITFTISEMTIHLENQNELNEVMNHLPNIEKMLCLDGQSNFERMEHLMHPVFMPRNEEEIMKNILTLACQIKYIHDLPQVIISFEKQTHNELYFTVIIVAAMQPGSPSIQEKFKAANSFLDYSHDRSKTLGLLRKNYTKEATVFNVKIPKHQFLRRDHFIDLNKARQTILKELTRIFGALRDFNGGMISKQHELLSAVKQSLQGNLKYNELLLENFFYSIVPEVMKTVAAPEALKSLFLLMHHSIENNKTLCEPLKIQGDSQYMCALIKTEDKTVKESVSRALKKFDVPTNAIASSCISAQETDYLGILYFTHDRVQQEKFGSLLQNSMLSSKV